MLYVKLSVYAVIMLIPLVLGSLKPLFHQNSGAFTVHFYALPKLSSYLKLYMSVCLGIHSYICA